MAVNKNFVVKNGLEVNENLIVANASDSFVGVGTSTPAYNLHVFGGIGATDVRVTGVSSFIGDVVAGTSGTTFSVINSSNMVGVGTDSPAYLVDIQGPAGTGYTSLYVKGDVRVTGDIVADDLVFDQGNFTNLEVSGITTTSELVVGYGASVAGIGTFGLIKPQDVLVSNASTITGRLTAQDVLVSNASTITGRLTAQDVLVSGGATVSGSLSVTGDLNVTGDISYDEVTGRNLNITGIATIHTLGVTSTTTTTDLAVGAAATVSGLFTAQDVLVSNASTITGNLAVTGDVTYDEASGRNLNITGIGTIHTLGVTSTTTTQDLAVSAGATIGQLNATDAVISGVLTATSFSGVGEIGIGSEGTPIGTGVTFLNIASSTEQAIAIDAPTSGIATVTITPGASLGMVLALGG